MASLYTFFTKSMQQVRADYLRTISNGLKAQALANGISNFQPNLGPNSDEYLRGTALAQEIAVIHANTVIANNNLMPDTAAGDYLDRWLSNLGLSRNPATPSFGYALCPCSVTSTLIVAGAQCIDPATGNPFFVTTTGNYGSTTPIPLQAVIGGSATDLPHGYVLQWVNTPAFMQQTLTIGVGEDDGLSGGNDSEVGVDEPPRGRLLSKMSSSAAPGNPSQIIQWCNTATPLVQSAAVYPALLGPSTFFFAVWRAAQNEGILNGSSYNRDLSDTLVNSTVVPYIAGNIPPGIFLCGVSVSNQPSDIALQVSLPSSPSAQPPGPGGGWIDGTPWPVSVGGTAPCKIVSHASSTRFQVNATTPPTVGASHVAFLDPTNWVLNTALVIAVTGSSGAYNITIDTPWPNMPTVVDDFGAAYIFPQSVNQQTYMDSILQAFSNLGPGEWSSSAINFRRPVPTQAFPYSLDANFLRTVEDSGPEVLSVGWIYREHTTPTVPAFPKVTVLADNFIGQLTLASLSGVFTLVNGSNSVATSLSQVGVVALGARIAFDSQSGVTYVVTGVSSSTITLSEIYDGLDAASANASATTGTPNVLVPRNIAIYPS